MNRPSPDSLAVISIFACWLLSIFIVGPTGDFPLNDDWSYARGVYSIVEEGKLTLETWPAMTLIAQIWIGTAFCEIFGFSFTSLRWSTLVVGLMSLFCYYALLRRFAKPALALFVCLLLLFNPLFFSLSFSFMTEVHFLLPLFATCIFFSRYIEKESYAALAMATLFSIYATLVRQPGVIIPLSFGLVLLFTSKSWQRKIIGLLPFIVSYITLKGYYSYLETYQPQVHKVGGMGDLVVTTLAKTTTNILEGSSSLLLYPALFLLPLVVLLLQSVEWKILRRRVAGSVVALAVLIYLAANLNLFPVGNVLYNLGLGPRLLIGVDLATNNIKPMLSEGLWGMIDYLAIIGAAGVLLLTVINLPLKLADFQREASIEPNVQIKWSIMLFCGAYFLLMLLIGSLFDRYTLVLIPFFAILILPDRYRSSLVGTIAGWTLLIATASFSVAATHDYLSWNRARKEAFNYVNKDMGIPIAYIDAGFELNGWDRPGPDRYGHVSEYSWWFVSKDDYALSFGDVKGFTKWKSYPYSTMLYPQSDSIFVLKKRQVVEIDYSGFPVTTSLEKLSSDGANYLSSNDKVELSSASLRSSDNIRSGKFAIKLSSENQYGLTTSFWGLSPGDTITYSAWRYPAGKSADIVFVSEYQKLFYLSETTVIKKEESGWEQIKNTIIIPDYSGIDRVSAFVWNQSGEEVWLDDVKVNRSK